MLLVFVVVGVVAGAAALASRAPAQQLPLPPPQPQPEPTPTRTQPVQAPPQQSGGASTTRPTANETSSSGLELPQGGGSGGGAQGILEFVGRAAGYIGEQVAETREGKAIAVPVGVGLAGATYIGLQTGVITVTAGGVTLGASAAAGALAIAVVVIAVNIIFIVDNILVAVKVGDWKKLAIEVGAMRDSGKYREAQVLWLRGVEKIGSQRAMVWPQPGEDWYRPTTARPLGEPYEGFPNAPKGANSAELARYPEQIPNTIPLKNGKELEVRRTLDLLRQDCADLKAWGMANGAPGRVVQNGVIVEVTKGPRDLRRWKPYADQVLMLREWCGVFESAISWIHAGALLGMYQAPLDAVEAQVSTLSIEQTTAAVEAKRVNQTETQARQILTQQGATGPTLTTRVVELGRDLRQSQDEARAAQTGSRTANTANRSAAGRGDNAPLRRD